MRGMLVAVALGLVVLVGGPAAHAAQADYPPGSPGIGVPSQPAPGQPAPAGPERLLREGLLPQTGNDLGGKLALGAGLIVAGGAIVIVTRRRSAHR